MLAFLVPTALATLVGLVVLWPPSSSSAAERAAAGSIPPDTAYPHATVVGLRALTCGGPTSGQGAESCATAVVRVEDGVDAGRRSWDFRPTPWLPACTWAASWS